MAEARKATARFRAAAALEALSAKGGEAAAAAAAAVIREETVERAFVSIPLHEY